MKELRSFFERVSDIHSCLAGEYPTSYFIVRFFLASSAIVSMHVYGYVHKLGIGVRPFIGVEVAADLIVDIVYNLLRSAVLFALVSFLLYVLALAAKKLLIAKLNGENRWPILPFSLMVAAAYFILGYVDLQFWSGAFGYSNTGSKFAFAVSLVSLIGASILYKMRMLEFGFLATMIIVFAMNLSYIFGAMKAGTIPEYAWKQVVFSDGTRLDGYPLHRVSDGVIFRKRDFFAFDTGAVFIPYSAVKFITEPSRDSSGELILSRDYPGIIITAP